MPLFGPQSVLERVRKTKKPVLATSEDHLELTSESISTIQADGVLSLPLFWWDLIVDEPFHWKKTIFLLFDDFPKAYYGENKEASPDRVTAFSICNNLLDKGFLSCRVEKIDVLLLGFSVMHTK